MIPGIIALFQSLPELIKLLNRMGDLIDRFTRWSHQNNIDGWIDKLEDSINNLEKAKTPDEKLLAAQSLVDLVRKLK